MNKKELYESIMRAVSVEVKKALNESDEKKNLTPEEKIEAWMNGEREENIKACGPDKLRDYYDICKEKGFEAGMRAIEKEAKSRNIKLNESSLSFKYRRRFGRRF